MIEFHKELLSELIKDWDAVQLEKYLGELRQREVELGKWIKYVKALQKKKVKKVVYDTDTRGGKG
jgi:hypothetical protein